VSIYFGFIGRGKGEGVQFSPSKKFFLDTHSDVNRAPETDLRSADGHLIAVISKADPSPVTAVRPNAPEPFSVKAADGQTDLYGIVYRPADFDPNHQYPVVDAIYAGPQTTWVSWNFTGGTATMGQAIANLGFVVVSVDARGTPNRGKQFQDVVYKSFGENEIPDHVTAIQQLAKTRPFMDLDRVGVYGGSFGGYFTVRALLQAPEFFKVGVAMAPATDLRDLSPSIAMYMGDSTENSAGYDRASNVSLAKNLKGHLLLIHGTADVNAPLSETMKMIDAFVLAGKPYDLVLLPDQTHAPQGAGQTYYLMSLKRYLVEHLKP
jgi:dipeptidyl aminopeptidase/acylaminoacyl peptidase